MGTFYALRDVLCDIVTQTNISHYMGSGSKLHGGGRRKECKTFSLNKNFRFCPISFQHEKLCLRKSLRGKRSGCFVYLSVTWSSARPALKLMAWRHCFSRWCNFKRHLIYLTSPFVNIQPDVKCLQKVSVSTKINIRLCTY